VVSSAGLVAGDVAGATVLLYDDLIASGETMRRAALALRGAGAASVVACAAHGLFIAPAPEVLRDDAIKEVWVSDSVPSFRIADDDRLRAKLRVVSCAPLFATALGSARDPRGD